MQYFFLQYRKSSKSGFYGPTCFLFVLIGQKKGYSDHRGFVLKKAQALLVSVIKQNIT